MATDVVIVTMATMIANIHILANMYSGKQMQHAGNTTEPFYKSVTQYHSGMCVCVRVFIQIYLGVLL